MRDLFSDIFENDIYFVCPIYSRRVPLRARFASRPFWKMHLFNPNIANKYLLMYVVLFWGVVYSDIAFMF